MPLGSPYYRTCPCLYKYRDIHSQRQRYRYKYISLGVSVTPTPYHKPPISFNIHPWYIRLRAAPRLPGWRYGVTGTECACRILLCDFEHGLEVVGITQTGDQGARNRREKKERRKDDGECGTWWLRFVVGW